MKRALLILFCALMSTQMFSESSSPYGTATSFAKTDVVSTTFNNDIEDISSDLRKKYLVEKITWYDDETNHKEAYYEYDNNNRLVRRIIHKTYFEQGRVKYDTIVDNYEYTRGNLTKISHKDVYVSYTYDLEYDNVGRLITSKYVNNIMHFSYRGGKMDSIWYDNDPECYTILKYDEHGNIVKEINRVPEMDDIWGETPTGDYVFIENEYEYDDKIRPFFNIDNAFVYDPIFGQGTTHPVYIRMLSTNNLIQYSGSSWHYTYNEEGLPIELRSRFEGVTPANDPKYVFTYRKIEKHQSSYKDQWCDTWNVLEHDMGMNFDTEKTWRHYIAQDTIINEQTYSIVNSYWTLEETNVYRSALVRFAEDKKVYAFIDDTEYLVYDFAVQVGDTVETIVGVGYGSMLQKLLVYQIDIDNLTNHKTITLYPICKMEDGECEGCDENGYYLWACCPIVWIEGVGSTDGFLMGYPPCGWVGGIGCKLLCAYKDEELRYTGGTIYEEYGCEYNATTAVKDIPEPKSSSKKFIQDHQLLIQSEGKTYNVLGVEVGNY